MLRCVYQLLNSDIALIYITVMSFSCNPVLSMCRWLVMAAWIQLTENQQSLDHVTNIKEL
jgi:hypothetical protein